MSMLWVLSASRSGSLLRAVIAQLVHADAMAVQIGDLALDWRGLAPRSRCQSSLPMSRPTFRPRQLTVAKNRGHDVLFATISSAIFACHATPWKPGRVSFQIRERPALIGFAMSEMRVQHPQRPDTPVIMAPESAALISDMSRNTAPVNNGQTCGARRGRGGCPQVRLCRNRAGLTAGGARLGVGRAVAQRKNATKCLRTSPGCSSAR